MSSSSNNSNNRRRRQRAGNSSGMRPRAGGIRATDPYLSLLSWDHRPTGVTGSLVPPDDLSRRRPNFTANQVPPRSLRNQIYWVQESKSVGPLTLSSSGSSEYNFAFALADLSNASNLAALFDQYFIHSVLAIFTFEDIVAPFPRLYTAIDYDSVAAISTVPAIQQYQSVLESICSPVLSVQRLVRPCCLGSVFLSSSSDGNAAVGPRWLDCDVSTVEHYGLRSITTVASNANPISLELVYTVGFRNVR